VKTEIQYYMAATQNAGHIEENVWVDGSMVKGYHYFTPWVLVRTK